MHEMHYTDHGTNSDNGIKSTFVSDGLCGFLYQQVWVLCESCSLVSCPDTEVRLPLSQN